MLQWLKNILYTLMAGLLLINTCSLGIMKIGFELNQDYFEANFCVNKKRPQLNCHGSCHLHKNLKKVQNNPTSKQGKRIQSSLFSVIFLAPTTYANQISNSFFEPVYQWPNYLDHYKYLSLARIFHPPTNAFCA